MPSSIAGSEEGAARRSRDAASMMPRGAASLRRLERTLLGSRMPFAEFVCAGVGWTREPLADACRRCGATRVRLESVEGGCGECRGSRLEVAAVVRLGRYAPPLSRWVPAIKSHAWKDMARRMGRELGLQVADAIDDARIVRPDVVVPMPVHWTRRLLRGIDHAGQLAEAAAAELACPCRNALVATCASRQSGRGRAARSSNGGRFQVVSDPAESRILNWMSMASRAIGLPERYPVAGKQSAWKGLNVLLIDDVRTTGTTSEEAASLLRAVGANSVTLAVCAVADAPRRASLHRARKPSTPAIGGRGWFERGAETPPEPPHRC